MSFNNIYFNGISKAWGRHFYLKIDYRRKEKKNNNLVVRVVWGVVGFYVHTY